MRFPFMFMAILSVAVAAWTVAYLTSSRLTDPFARVTALAGALIFVGLAAYQLYRRLRHGPEA